MKAYVLILYYDYEGHSEPLGVFVGDYPTKEQVDGVLVKRHLPDSVLMDHQYETLKREGDVGSNSDQPGDEIHLYEFDVES